MTIIKIEPKQIFYSRKIQKLCLRKGGSFPKGCPNYGKKSTCPPEQPLISQILDFKYPAYLIYTDFNVKKVAERMKEKHPFWTKKQCYNPRYWQGTARKQHKEELVNFLEQHPGLIVNTSPESHGVNVHKLMKDVAGIQLEWPPRNLTRRVSLGGYLHFPKKH